MAIEYVTLDEDAEYTVVAKNIAGEARSRCQLIVEPKQEEGVYIFSVTRKKNET